MVYLLPVFERLSRRRLYRKGMRSVAVPTPEGRLHSYEGRGDSAGPPMVMLHGIGSSATAYAALLARLRPHASVLWAPDLPGHGFSDPVVGEPRFEELYQRVARAIDARFDAPFVLIGTSLGGGLALRYAIERPEKVARLVLCSPAGAQMSDAAFAQLKHTFRMDRRTAGVEFVDRLFDRPPVYRRLLGREVRHLLGRPLVQRLVHNAGPEDFLSAEEVAGLQPPTLLLWGTEERLLPEECLDWFRQYLPGHVQIERPAGFGHSAHLERPAQLARRIVEFIDGASGELS
ncbi:MAG: alpha/beta fold hydrolase [Myxococcales bacterium]|nr:alpha/beta fold hydrolase [Myxococcales bacterium]